MSVIFQLLDQKYVDLEEEKWRIKMNEWLDFYKLLNCAYYTKGSNCTVISS